MENILIILFGHYIFDYPLQPEYIAKTKGTDLYNLFVHSMIYGLGMAFLFKFIGSFAIWKAFVLVISHIIIDGIKAHSKNKELQGSLYLYIDQLLHLLINLILYMI